MDSLLGWVAVIVPTGKGHIVTQYGYNCDVKFMVILIIRPYVLAKNMFGLMY